MKDSVDVVIIGAGPGGLACGKLLAANGLDVLIVERKKIIGPKICAGGITWSGLLQHVPEHLLEGAFRRQHIVSNLQSVQISSTDPIIATISRKTLGQWMAKAAQQAGAIIAAGTCLHAVSRNYVTVKTADDIYHKIKYQHLVGADGSTSAVRKYLAIPSNKMGIGINYQIDGSCSTMEWHLNTKLFGSGYGWIFPHKKTLSIGAYCDHHNMSAAKLKNQLICWAALQGYNLKHETCRAALVNYDYQGFCFDNIWLVGDAAGLASGLTGEGIYPAIVSGEAVAKKIITPLYPAQEILAMVKKQKRHQQVIKFAGKNSLLCSLLMEWLVLLLRLKVLDFHALEMAD